MDASVESLKSELLRTSASMHLSPKTDINPIAIRIDMRTKRDDVAYHGLIRNAIQTTAIAMPTANASTKAVPAFFIQSACKPADLLKTTSEGILTNSKPKQIAMHRLI